MTSVLLVTSFLTFCNPMDCSPPGSSVHGDSPGWNTDVGCHVLLQEIFPTQWSNLCFLHCRHILYHLTPQGKPKNTGLDSLSLLQGSSLLRNQTAVSWIAGRFFTSYLGGITTMVWSLTQNQTSWNVKPNGPQEALLQTKVVEMMAFQLSYLKS